MERLEKEIQERGDLAMSLKREVIDTTQKFKLTQQLLVSEK